MTVSAAPSSVAAALVARRGLVALIFIGIAAAVGIGFYRSAYPDVDSSSPAGNALSDRLHQGANGLRTVADMLLGRSPGERTVGALALKHKQAAMPHERALPKIRRAAPQSPLAAIVGSPETPLSPAAAAPPPGTTLYNAVNGPPALAEAPPSIVFPGMPPPPSGGGGLVGPPVVTQVVPPPPPGSAVPEPASWALMLIGFLLLGRASRGAIVRPSKCRLRRNCAAEAA